MNIVIMAGGAGTRFWPMSRSSRPKQLLKVIGEQPMVRATYERVRDLAPDDRILLVVGQEHLAETQGLFADTGVTILAESMGRNTAPCIGLAARLIASRGNDEPMVILPADHYIAKPAVFQNALRQAASRAVHGGIVTLGIVPTRPETGYGYIEQDPHPPHGPDGANIYRVLRFVEKPQLELAKQYLMSGNFYWNAGIFVATPSTLLSEFALRMPEFYRGLEELAPSFNTPGFDVALAGLYLRTESISFDYAIMEATSQVVHVIPCDCGWSDVGSWNSLYEVRTVEQDDRGNVQEGDAVVLDCAGCFVLSRGKRLVAVLGLSNVLVVDTEDALLVADLERSQDVKKITAYLQAEALKHLL
jgi:mannose-1-phosphate guanylyltransferase